MVSVLIMQGQYPDALKLAEANYKSDPDNTYHILAFFRCLVRKHRLDADDVKTLNELNNNSPFDFGSTSEYQLDKQVTFEKFNIVNKQNYLN